MEITKENLINHFGMVETEGDEVLLFPTIHKSNFKTWNFKN